MRPKCLHDELIRPFFSALGFSWTASLISWTLQGKYKYDAWKAMVDEGVSSSDAQTRYVKLVNELVTKYGLKKK